MVQLHNKLCIAKSSLASVKFGRLNIIFLGDFLQLPCISAYYLYMNKPMYQLGHTLWRSLNAVVILTEQMRQIDDPLWAQILHRLRLQIPTDNDLRIIRSHIGAPISHSPHVPIITRHNDLRSKINNEMIHETSRRINKPITYCVANVKSHSGMSIKSVYKLKYGAKNVLGDALVPLLPGCPLMVTKNIDQTTGNLPSHVQAPTLI